VEKWTKKKNNEVARTQPKTKNVSTILPEVFPILSNRCSVFDPATASFIIANSSKSMLVSFSNFVELSNYCPFSD
jgi:hypothetical protein